MSVIKEKNHDALAGNLDVVRICWCEAKLQTGPNFSVTTDDVMSKFKCSINSARNALLTYRRINGESVKYDNRSGQLRASNKFQPSVTKGSRPDQVLAFVDMMTDEGVVKMVKEARKPAKAEAA